MSSEVRKTLEKTKKQGPNIDNPTSDVMILGEDKSVKQITKLFNKILETKKIPVEWKEANMIKQHKKGDRTNINNYRTISPLFHAFKLFTATKRTGRYQKSVLDS